MCIFVVLSHFPCDLLSTSIEEEVGGGPSLGEEVGGGPSLGEEVGGELVHL